MKKNNSIKEEEEVFTIPTSTIELEDLIEEMFETQKNKRGKPPKEWKDKINVLINKVNSITKITIYKLVK